MTSFPTGRHFEGLTLMWALYDWREMCARRYNLSACELAGREYYHERIVGEFLTYRGAAS